MQVWKIQEYSFTFVFQNVCQTLWCSVKGFCRSKLDAAADGTRCGEKKVTCQVEEGRWEGGRHKAPGRSGERALESSCLGEWRSHCQASRGKDCISMTPFETSLETVRREGWGPVPQFTCKTSVPSFLDELLQNLWSITSAELIINLHLDFFPTPC